MANTGNSIKILKAVEPQKILERIGQLVDENGSDPEFENPRLQVVLKSGTSYSGYVLTYQPNEPKVMILSLIMRHDTDETRDIAYFKLADVESVTFFDIEPVINHFRF